MTTAAPSTTLATIQPAFTDAERLALAASRDRALHRHHGRGEIRRPQGRHGLAGCLREIDPARLGGFARRGAGQPGQ